MSTIKLLILTGPSGSGKSTLINHLVKSYPSVFGFSISHTTRNPRPGDIIDVSYTFTTLEEFNKLQAENGFIETTEYSGNKYGTSLKALMKVVDDKKIPVLDVNVVGVKTVRIDTRVDPFCVFIEPPNLEILESRLRARKSDSEEAIQKRLAAATKEIQESREPGLFDEFVINDDADNAFARLEKIIVEKFGIPNEKKIPVPKLSEEIQIGAESDEHQRVHNNSAKEKQKNIQETELHAENEKKTMSYAPYPPKPGTVDPASNAWVLTSSALVLIMIPGLGYFYSGLSHHKNALVLLHLTMLSLAIVSLQWFLWGYSLAFDPEGGPFIGNLSYSALSNVANQAYPNTVVSTDAFVIFQCMFAALTAALPFGSAADRTRILPSIIFLFVWSTLVYDPIAYWVWAPNGWLKKLGYLDFAGGCPVEVNSGFAGLALAIYMGPRLKKLERKIEDAEGGIKVKVEDEEEKPHNTGYVILGTSLLWFGWLGFNGGSALMADRRAGLAVIATNLAGSVGGLVWMALDFFKTKKYSSIGFCTGAVAGLVAITPAAGYVAPWGGMVIGLLAGSICRAVCLSLKKTKLVDDSLDVFGVHGVGGIIGNICVGFFASGWVMVDSPGSVGGWLDGNYKQLGWQILATVVCASWSFCITYAILFFMDRIPGLRLRVKQNHEEAGLDVTQIGELAYTYMVATPIAGFTDKIDIDLDPSKQELVDHEDAEEPIEEVVINAEWGGTETIEAVSEI